MLGPVARISNQLGRSVLLNSVRRHGYNGGIPAENMPFSIHSKWRLTFNLFWFVGTGVAAPFLIMLHQMRKSAN